eukprot:11909908-Ditylum_brightwellii.AAC.1
MESTFLPRHIDAQRRSGVYGRIRWLAGEIRHLTTRLANLPMDWMPFLAMGRPFLGLLGCSPQSRA